MHKKIGLQKALLTFPSYVLLTNELHPLSDETTILGEALFIEHSLALCIIYKSARDVNGFLLIFSIFPISIVWKQAAVYERQDRPLPHC